MICRRYELAELKHSRLAMIAIGGFVHQVNEYLIRRGVLYINSQMIFAIVQAIITKTPVLEQIANFQPIQSAV